MNAKIIQIATVVETEETYGGLFALTEDGRIFSTLTNPHSPHFGTWREVQTKDFVHRTGKLIGD